MTAFSESLARGIVRHRRRFSDQRLRNGKYKGFLVELERDGFVIETRRRPPRAGIPAGTDVLHFDWPGEHSPESIEDYEALPGLDVWVSAIDKRGRPLPDRGNLVLKIKSHALERYIYRTGNTEHKDMLAEFSPPLSYFATLPLLERTALLDSNFLITATGSGPLQQDESAKVFDPESGFKYPIPALVTWIPDALTREENMARLERVQAARAEKKWYVSA